jgi:CRP-like cAMP-binding protein
MAEAIAKECGTMNKLAASIPVRVAMWDDRVDATEDGVAASILSLVDGRATVAEIAEQSGLAPAEAVKLIEDFVASGVLRLDPAPI